MADLGAKAAKQLGEITECPICMSAFNDPKMLPCIHTFCFECLKRTAEADHKKPGDKMPCPLCRKDFIIPADGVNGLQKNFFMENFLEFKTTLQSVSAVAVCDMCNVRNEGKTGEIPTATMRCIECQDNYCDSCVKVHKFQKLIRNHQFVKIGSDAASEMKRSLVTVFCTEHSQKPLDYYCADCKKIVCVSCFVESHASHKCKDVTKVDEEFRQAIQRYTSKVSICTEEMLSFRKKAEIRKTDFLKVISDTENSIHKRNQELKDMIDEHTKSLFGELSVIKSKHLKEMETEVQEIDRHCTTLRSFQEYCTKLVSEGSPSDICSSVDQLLARADELEVDHKAFICRPYQSVEVSFQTTDLREALQKSRNFLGQIKDSLSLRRNLVKDEASAKTTYQRSEKGPISIAECSADGQFITIENTGRKVESLGAWSLKRNIDGSEKCDFKMASDFVIKPCQKIKLWARGSKPSNANAYDIETDQTSFGSGDIINTRLVNQSGEERAIMIQRTIYKSSKR